MNILLTGGTGFLGRTLLQPLLDEGHSLFCLVRRSGISLPAGVTPIVSDLGAPDLKTKLSDYRFDTAIHLAAEIATARDGARVMQVNHAGTVNLVEALRDCSLRYFLFASTVVVGQANGALLTEETALDAQTTYGKSKQASERYLLDLFGQAGFPAVIFRPSHVYGPGGWFAELLRDMKRGLFRLPGGGANLWDVVHVDDVVAAICLLLHKGTPGEIYHVADDTPVSMKDFFTEAGLHLGKKKIGSAPVWLANLLKGREPVLAAIRSARSSNRKLRALGWAPRSPEYRTGLAATFEKLQARQEPVVGAGAKQATATGAAS
jgi:nucleoside-diphosphate-sugar epimerase